MNRDLAEAKAKSRWPSTRLPSILPHLMLSFAAFSPAKVNLFLAITDRRADGFHNLVSVAAPLDFGDTLWFEPDAGSGLFSLSCEQPDVPLDSSNLILKAAKLYLEHSGLQLGGSFILKKQIPMGAGLGGGSSNASSALRLLNEYAGRALTEVSLAGLAARLGSDCPLFLETGAVVMRGRGESLSPLPRNGLSRLSGRRLVLFKPTFGISTPWAYQQMAADPATYLPAADAEARLADWLGDASRPAEALLYNNMEIVAFRKFVALPSLLALIKSRYGLEGRMSGSGSCCFLLLPEDFDYLGLEVEIRAALGGDAFVQAARLR